jgi:hypothetical protein
MSTAPRSFALASLMLALVAIAGEARAQRGPGVTVESAKNAKISVAPGAVITTAFTVKNATRDSVMVEPILSLPAGWHTVMTAAPSIVGPVSSDLWLISVVAPANAPAGRYVIRLRLGIGTPRTVARGDVWAVGTARDSVVVSVSDRHDVTIHAGAHQTFVMGGDSYSVKFIVRNRGNVASRIKVRASSNQGASPTLNVAELELVAGQVDTVTATVAIPANVARSSQQLLEVVAIDQSADSARADASVETTIIPKMNTATPDFWTVPGELSLRAAAPGTGVSPFVASGSGRISQNSDATVDFSFRNSAGPASIFGERAEYRFGLRGKNAGIRLGDDSYGFSLLTSGGSQSTGGELRGSVGDLTGGAYVQHNRWTPNSPTEMAAMVGTSPMRALSASAVMLERGKSGTDARVLSAAAQGSIFGAHLEAEAAKSDSQLVVGTAAVARLYGNLPTFTYDFGAQRASDGYAGIQHASGDAHVSLSGQAVGPLILSAMGSLHTTNPTPQSAGFGQQIATSTASANLRNGSGLEFERFDRVDRGMVNAIRGNQQSLRLRVHLASGPIDLQGSVQRGIVAELDSALTRGFMTFSGSARTAIGSDQYISIFTEVSDGRALAAGGVGTATAGGNTELHLGGTSLRLTGSATAQRDNMAAWVGQADVAVEHQVLRSIVALKGRIGLAGSNTIGTTNAFYVEVRTPLHIPTRRLVIGGRARAQVVDAETGKGVAGAMVRMGELSAITDKNGAAMFTGLHAGQYNAVVEGGITAGQLVSGGTAITVRESRTPVAFTLSVARGAHVAATIRRYEAVSLSGSGPRVADSLIDVGAVSQALISLAGSRDTLWQTSDDRGRIDFGSLAPGHYVMSVVGGDLPEFTAFERRHIDIDVVAGEQREVELRVLPQQRVVQFIGSETVLVAAPIKPTLVKPQGRPNPNP